MNSFLLLLQYALIIVGIIEIPVGFSLAKSSGCYVSAIFGIWLILELVVFSVIKSKVPKWVLAFMATIGMASLFIKYTFTGELRNFGLALMLLIGPVCFTPMYPLSLLGDWISKEKAKETALTKYKNDKNMLINPLSRFMFDNSVFSNSKITITGIDTAASPYSLNCTVESRSN